MYSGSHNKVHAWKAMEDFGLVSEIQTQYGTIYSMAVTKLYLIVGKCVCVCVCVCTAYFCLSVHPCTVSV